MEENKVSYEQLEQENQQLKEQLDNIETSKKFQKKAAKWTLRKGFGVFLGKDLKDAIKQTLTEFNTEKKVSTDTASNLGAHIIWRITRIGIFAVIIAILPTLFLIIQTVYLGKQNQKIDKQNELITNQNTRLEQQTYLQEADRRSSLVFLSSNVLDQMYEELKDTLNTDRNLSDQLIGRIVSLSRSLKPYKYLEKDSLSFTMSPERGQLLINLVKSNLNRRTYEKIFESADFSFSELKNITFEYIPFGHINLSNSIFEDVTFLDCDFGSPNFSKSLIESLRFQNCLTYDMDFSESYIQNVSFDNFTARFLKLDLAFVYNFQFSQSFIFYLSVYESYITYMGSDSVYVDNFQFVLNDGKLKSFFKQLHPEKYKSWKSLESYYNIDGDFKYTGGIFVEPFFYDSELSEYTMKKIDSFFVDNFKTVKILLEEETTAYDSYFINENVTKTKDSLQITYTNTDSEISREVYLEDIKSTYEEEIEDYEDEELDFDEDFELLLTKRKYELIIRCMSRGEAYKKGIDYENYKTFSGVYKNYDAFKKSKYYNSKN